VLTILASSFDPIGVIVAVHLYSIQTGTPSLGKVFPEQSRPLDPSMQVLCLIGFAILATMDSSDFLQRITLVFP